MKVQAEEEIIKEDQVHKDIGFLVKTISERFRSSIGEAVCERGLTMSQMMVLQIIRKNGGSSNQRNIERILEVAHPTVVGLVARLEKNGFVTCRTDPENRRNKIVEMTDKSYQAFDFFESGYQDFQKVVFKGFSAEEKEQLLCFLERLRENLESDPRKAEIKKGKLFGE